MQLCVGRRRRRRRRRAHQIIVGIMRSSDRLLYVYCVSALRYLHSIFTFNFTLSPPHEWDTMRLSVF